MLKNFLLILLLIMLTAAIVLGVIYRDSLNIGSLIDTFRRGQINFEDIKERLVEKKEDKTQTSIPPELEVDARKSKIQLDLLLSYARKNNVSLGKDIESTLQKQDFIKANIMLKDLLSDRVISWKKLFVVQGIYAAEGINKDLLRTDIEALIADVRKQKDINSLATSLTRKYPEGIVTTTTIDKYLCDSTELNGNEALKKSVGSLKVKEISGVIEKEGYGYATIYVVDGNTSIYCNFDEFLASLK